MKVSIAGLSRKVVSYYSFEVKNYLKMQGTDVFFPVITTITFFLHKEIKSQVSQISLL